MIDLPEDIFKAILNSVGQATSTYQPFPIVVAYLLFLHSLTKQLLICTAVRMLMAFRILRRQVLEVISFTFEFLLDTTLYYCPQATEDMIQQKDSAC